MNLLSLFSLTETDFFKWNCGCFSVLSSLRLSLYLCYRGKTQVGTLLLKMEKLTDSILLFFSKDAARERSVVSARPAGEGPGAEGDALFTLSSSICVWLLWGRFREQQPKRKYGRRGTKGNLKKGSWSKGFNKEKNNSKWIMTVQISVFNLFH